MKSQKLKYRCSMAPPSYGSTPCSIRPHSRPGPANIPITTEAQQVVTNCASTPLFDLVNKVLYALAEVVLDLLVHSSAEPSATPLLHPLMEWILEIETSISKADADLRKAHDQLEAFSTPNKLWINILAPKKENWIAYNKSWIASGGIGPPWTVVLPKRSN
ncbi:uncharacterized protein LOC127260658 [Andrographis paniculata]|uniref:uncharacterized protein LOC127260658 n=1 Tax=Andrographis paniculata TaxID=175694 RepID=UPI0021E8D136|nr:uncharacterized protein LOC127260658 [Andrographis paniculata]